MQADRPGLSLHPPPPSMVHMPLVQILEQGAALGPPPPAPQASAHYSAVPAHATVKEEEDDGDWPPPPPPEADEDANPQLSTTILPTDLVAELMACLKRIEMTPEQLEFPRLTTVSRQNQVMWRDHNPQPPQLGPPEAQRNEDFYSHR